MTLNFIQAIGLLTAFLTLLCFIVGLTATILTYRYKRLYAKEFQELDKARNKPAKSRPARRITEREAAKTIELIAEIVTGLKPISKTDVAKPKKQQAKKKAERDYPSYA